VRPMFLKLHFWNRPFKPWKTTYMISKNTVPT
jgi:hypothetical protein